MRPQVHIQWNTWIKIRPGIQLNFYNFTPGKPSGKFDRHGAQATFELDFILEGQWYLEIVGSDERPWGMVNKASNSYLHFICPGMMGAELRGEVLSGDNLKGILVSIDAKVMSDMAGRFLPPLPDFISTALPDHPPAVVGGSPIIPAIRMVIQQILVPPVGRSISGLYLEGKIIELIALKLSQCHEQQAGRKEPGLSAKDLRHIQRARKILVADILNPPSIPELARKVGINEQKLKSGFRRVYGDTVYRTLRATRMEKARNYFDQAEDNILQVANQVGYANPSHFAAAFRDCFGMTPSVYLSSQR